MTVADRISAALADVGCAFGFVVAVLLMFWGIVQLVDAGVDAGTRDDDQDMVIDEPEFISAKARQQPACPPPPWLKPYPQQPNPFHWEEKA